MRVLVVDDEPTCAGALRARLERLGHEVVEAADGLEAWDRLSAGDIRLVITDWLMPGLDGPGLCRRIRAASGPYTYVILMTALSAPEQRIAGLDAGADDFLSKRPDLSELTARLRIAERILAMQAELQEKNRRLQELATTDELTGVRNRGYFEGSLRAEAASAARSGSPLSIVLLDVDHFKSFNDTFGHPAGDAVLRALGEVLRSTTRGNEVAARYGGEEFAIILPRTGPDGAAAYAERLRLRVERSPWPGRPVTASLGVATTASGDGAGLIAAADAALYESKRGGRNRVTVARPPAGAVPLRRLRVEG